MAEVKDYSGEFNPNLRLTDFSKEALIKLLISTSKAYLGVDGLWTTMMRGKVGDRAAFDLDKEMWFSKGLEHDIKRTVEPMNIEGNDIATLFKYWQCCPSFAVTYTGPTTRFQTSCSLRVEEQEPWHHDRGPLLLSRVLREASGWVAAETGVRGDRPSGMGMAGPPVQPEHQGPAAQDATAEEQG